MAQPGLSSDSITRPDQATSTGAAWTAASSRSPSAGSCSRLASGGLILRQLAEEQSARRPLERDRGRGAGLRIQVDQMEARVVRRGPEAVATTLERGLVPDPGAQELPASVSLRERSQALGLFGAEDASRDRERVSHVPLALDVDSQRVGNRQRDQHEPTRVREVELELAALGHRGLPGRGARELDRIRIAIEVAAEHPAEERPRSAPSEAMGLRLK